jgi:hypothetical protein
MRTELDSASSFFAGSLLFLAFFGMVMCLLAPLLNAYWLWDAGTWLIAPFVVCLILAGSVAGIAVPFRKLRILSKHRRFP